jgi:1,4-dihydroxy-2-naphthoyl-CoA synthase
MWRPRSRISRRTFRLVGTAKAREVYFLSGIIDTEVAGSIGLVSRAFAEKRRPVFKGR